MFTSKGYFSDNVLQLYKYKLQLFDRLSLPAQALVDRQKLIRHYKTSADQLVDRYRSDETVSGGFPMGGVWGSVA